MRLQDALKVKMSINSPHALGISRSIGKFIAADMFLYSIVESEGFKQMILTLELKYKLPSRTYFSDNVMITQNFIKEVNGIEMSPACLLILTLFSGGRNMKRFLSWKSLPKLCCAFRELQFLVKACFQQQVTL